WLDGKPPNLDETREALQRIVRDGNRASDVVARIRALLKNNAPTKTQFNIGEMIAEIITLTETEAQRCQVSVQTLLAPNLPRVTADRVQLQQVLMNLTLNALDALSEVIDRSRILTIEVEMESPNTVLVAVHDTGIGIDPERMKQLFEPFHTTKTHGLGLGLSISRSIIEAHGGRLWMTPNDGPGVTFQFSLPVQNGGAT
ncbi:MAG: nodV1, partial [Verrucomicrobiales bacterium]|nr:nodV1 [Verrucomicrobiales bacterium]